MIEILIARENNYIVNFIKSKIFGFRRTPAIDSTGSVSILGEVGSTSNGFCEKR